MDKHNSQTSLTNFIVLEKLGEGSFATVYKVKRVDDGGIYAMKKVKIGQMKEKQRDNALNQVRVLASITHPNIINYKEAFFDEVTQALCIVMQFADAGDIQKKINVHAKNYTYFTESQIWVAFIQMAKGLRALHQINILHRDLKCANVFCTKDNKFKLGDLNVSKVAKRGMARTQTGTPYYTSPEVWKDRPYDSKCDIWSLGCVIYEMASLSPPFRASNLKELYSKIQRGIFNRIPEFYSQDLAEVIKQCLKVNPQLRPSAKQILQNPRVMRNTPLSQKYGSDNDQTKSINLINTILCPKNLKSLKIALPGAKYDHSKSSERLQNPISSQRNRELSRKLNKVVSSQNLPKAQNILSVKPNELKRVESLQPPIRGQLIRKPSSQRIPLPQRILYNNINIKKAEERSLSKRRQELIKYIPQRQRQKISRNNSVQSLDRKKDCRSVHSQKNSSRQRVSQNNIKKEQKKDIMEQINQKCRNIKERVQMLMLNRYNQNKYIPRKELQRNKSRSKQQIRERSLNNRNDNSRNRKVGQINNYVQRRSSKSIQRNRSIQRLQKEKYAHKYYMYPYKR